MLDEPDELEDLLEDEADDLLELSEPELTMGKASNNLPPHPPLPR